MVDFITQNGPIFHKIFKISVVINQKLCDICGQKLVLVVSTIRRYYKHTKFRQNPRGDPKFLVNLTQNDPDTTAYQLARQDPAIWRAVQSRNTTARQLTRIDPQYRAQEQQMNSIR